MTVRVKRHRVPQEIPYSISVPRICHVRWLVIRRALRGTILPVAVNTSADPGRVERPGGDAGMRARVGNLCGERQPIPGLS